VINSYREGLHMDHLYYEGICGQPTLLFGGQKLVQLTVCVLNHIILKDEYLT